MRQRGFSLLEVLFAMAVLTVVILMSLAAFLERNKRLEQANETIRAYQALANEAEQQRRVRFPEVASAKGFLSNTSEILRPLTPYETEVDVKPESLGVKNVTLVVRWKGGRREARLTLVRTDTGGPLSPNLW